MRGPSIVLFALSFLISLLGPSADVALALDVNGQLKSAQLEKLSSNPVTNEVEARIFWDTTQKAARVYDGTIWKALGSGGSGSGANNLISSPSTATCWTETGSVFATPTTTTAGGDLPSASEGSAIQFVATNSGTEATDYVSCSVTTDADQSGYLPLTFSMRPGTGFAANEWTVSVYQSSTRIALNTDVSSVTYLPNLTTSIDQIHVPVEPSTTYTIRFARVSGSGSATLNVAKVFFGSAQLARVPPKTARKSFTPSWTAGRLVASGTGAINVGFWHQDGPDMVVEFGGNTGSAGGGTSGALTLAVPGGYTIDTASLPSTSAEENYLGEAQFNEAGTSVDVWVKATGATAVTFSPQGSGSTNYQATNVGTSQSFSGWFRIPILEWRGAVVAIPTNNNRPVSFSAHNNGVNLTLAPNASRVQVAFSSVTSSGAKGWNEGSGYDTSDKSFVAPATGKYRFRAGVYITGGNTLNNIYLLELRRGSTYAASTSIAYLDRQVPAAGANLFLNGTVDLNLSAGDRIYLAVFGQGDNSSSTLTVDATVDRSSFEGYRLTDENNNPIVGIPVARDGQYGLVYYNEFLDTTTAPSNGAGTSPSGYKVAAVRVGKSVTVSVQVTTGSGTPTAQINWTTILPSWARPPDQKISMGSYDTVGNWVTSIVVETAGTVRLEMREWVDATDPFINRNFDTATTFWGTISYVVD
jgi:hypothetical protein